MAGKAEAIILFRMRNLQTSLSNTTGQLSFRAAALALAAAILCLALLAGKARPVRAGGCLDRFLVRPGDTLTGIASAYGFSWQVIARLNDLEAPYDLYAGQWLCLPAVVGAEAAAATPHPSRLPSFTVQVAGGWVEVQTRNFPPKNSFVVKIAENRGASTTTWHKAGILRTKQGGAILSRFRLPAKLKNTRLLLVCLKNSVSDVQTCTAAYNLQ